MKAVRSDLEAGAALDSWAGRLALTLARQLEAPGMTGVTGLSAQLQRVMTEALGPKVHEPVVAEPAVVVEEDEITKARRRLAEHRATAG